MSDRQYNRFVGEIVGAGVMVHAIQLTANRQSSTTNYAIHLAGSTGGRYASVAVATALPQALTTLATDLGAHYDDVSTRYRVVYERPDPPGASVSVSVARPTLGVRLFGDRRLD